MTIQHRTNVFWLRIALTLVAITVTTSIAHADTTSVSGPNGAAGVAGAPGSGTDGCPAPDATASTASSDPSNSAFAFGGVGGSGGPGVGVHRQTVATAVWEEAPRLPPQRPATAPLLSPRNRMQREARVAAGIRPGAGQSFGTVRLERVAKEALQLPRHRQAAHTHPIRSWSLLLPSVEQAAVAPAAFRTRVWGAMVE